MELTLNIPEISFLEKYLKAEQLKIWHGVCKRFKGKDEELPEAMKKWMAREVPEYPMGDEDCIFSLLKKLRNLQEQAKEEILG